MFEMTETKQALGLLADWYKKGYIHPDFITDDTTGVMRQKFIAGKIGYMNLFGNYANAADLSNPNGIASLVKNNFASAECASSIVPKGPNGKSGNFVWGEGGHIMALGKQLSKDPEKVNRILKILEVMQNDQKL